MDQIIKKTLIPIKISGSMTSLSNLSGPSNLPNSYNLPLLTMSQDGYGFFNSASKTFALPIHGKRLGGVPTLCCRRSFRFPNYIPEVNMIWPTIINSPKMDKGNSNDLIPIFRMTPLETTKNYETTCRFYLTCVPPADPKDNLVISNSGTSSELVTEYWRDIMPMAICQNCLGYYLGKSDDVNRIIFEICSEQNAESWLQEAVFEGSTPQMYGNNISFKSSRIFVKRNTKSA